MSGTLSTARSKQKPSCSLAHHINADTAGEGCEPSTYRWTLPLHAPRLAGVWPQLLEAEGSGASWELGVPEEDTTLDALLLEGFIVLVEVLDCIVVITDPLGSQAVPLQPGSDPPKGHHSWVLAPLPPPLCPAMKRAL